MRIGGDTERATEILVPLLAKGSDEARQLAAAHLGETGPAAVPALIDALSDPHPGVREQAAYALGCLTGTDAADALEVALEDREHDGVRFNAAVALANIGRCGAAVQTLVQFLDPDAEIRVGDGSGLFVRQSDAALRVRAAKALEEIGAQAVTALPALRNRLDDTDESVRRAAKDAIALIDAHGDPTR